MGLRGSGTQSIGDSFLSHMKSKTVNAVQWVVDTLLLLLLFLLLVTRWPVVLPNFGGQERGAASGARRSAKRLSRKP